MRGAMCGFLFYKFFNNWARSWKFSMTDNCIPPITCVGKILIIKCFEFVSGSGLLVGTESILFFLTGYSNDENSRHHTPYSSLNYAYFEFVYQKSRFSLIIMLSYISCLRKYFSTFPRAPSFNSAKANFIEYLPDLISDLSPVERILTSRTLFNSWYLY